MTYKIIFEKVKKEQIPLLETLAKTLNLTYTRKNNKTKAEIIAEMEKESEEMNMLYKKGKLKTFSSMEEYRKYRGIK